MEPSEPTLDLADIAEACRRIERFAAGRDDDQITSDEIESAGEQEARAVGVVRRLLTRLS